MCKARVADDTGKIDFILIQSAEDVMQNNPLERRAGFCIHWVVLKAFDIGIDNEVNAASSQVGLTVQ